MNRSREPIMQAFKTRLQSAPGFVTVTRRLYMFSDLAPEQKPALLILEPAENCDNGSTATPGVNTFEVILFVYMVADTTGSVENMPALNALLDSIDSALTPDPYGEQCTLGGLVYQCCVDGRIDKDPGDKNGIGYARVPVKILVP